MPASATITSFYTFTAGTKARAAQVNTNFSIFRGHLLPIDPNTQTAINNTYDLGSSEYYWRSSYIKQINCDTISASTIVATTATVSALVATSIQSTNINVSALLTAVTASITTSYVSKQYVSGITFADYIPSSGATTTITAGTTGFVRANVPANSNTGIYISSENASDASLYIIRRADTVTARQIVVSSTSSTYYLFGSGETGFFAKTGNTIFRLGENSSWASFTPTGGWSGANVTYTGKFRKQGDSIDIEVHIALSGLPSGTTLTVDIPFPTVWTIDTAKLASTDNLVLGDAVFSDGSTRYRGIVSYATTTGFKLWAENASGTYTTLAEASSSVPFTFNTGDSVIMRAYKIPITNMS